MCCIPNQRHREAERENAISEGSCDGFVEKVTFQQNLDFDEWELTQYRNRKISPERLYLQRPQSVKKHTHGVVFSAHGEVLGVLEPEMNRRKQALKSRSVYGLAQWLGFLCCKHRSLR